MLNMSRALAVLWVIFGLGDLVTTHYGLQVANAYEANPIGAFLLGHSVLLFYGLKAAVVLGFGGLLWAVAGKCTLRQLKLFCAFQFVVVAAYVMIVVNNLMIVVA